MKIQKTITRRDFIKLAALAPAGYLVASAGSSLLGNLSADEKISNLFLVLDTVSARNMSLYGYTRRTTPQIERFAERATVYHNHHASGNFTTPGTASLMTGAYPWSHRAFHVHGVVSDSFTDKTFFRTSPPGTYRVAYSHNYLVVSLLQQFRDQMELFLPARHLALADLQYSDLIFPNDYNVSSWSERLILLHGGSKQGSLFFSMLYSLYQRIVENRLLQSHPQYDKIPELNGVFFFYDMKDATDWLIDNWSTMPKPALGYFHLLPPHEPYTPPAGFRGKFNDGYAPPAKPKSFASEGHSEEVLNQQRQAYDEYLAYADAELGRLFSHLEQTGALESTRVILTADHGEIFERGIRGHETPVLYEPLLHIPLIIWEPGQASRIDVRSLTSCVDILPTLCQLGGVAIPDWCEGQVLPPYASLPPDKERIIYAVEAKSNPAARALRRATLALYKGSYKLIRYMKVHQTEVGDELFNLDSDPEELNNLTGSQKDIAEELGTILDQKIQQVNQPYS